MQTIAPEDENDNVEITTSTPSATFSVVATPIGNMEDITLRALRTLKEADLILCEDTRITKHLLVKYAISSPTMSYHDHSDISKIETILELIPNKKIALVSDAGTPGISDPGAFLVTKIREHFASEIASGDIKIEAIPGPSAVIAALSIAGVPCADFTFLGFLPHKKGRETLFKEIAATVSGESNVLRTVVFYESPHRIGKALESLATHLEGMDVMVVVTREITKVYEEIVRGTPLDLVAYFIAHQDKVRGEFVVIVAPKS